MQQQASLEDVARYVATVSVSSGLGMTAQRQSQHTEAFRRLLDEANALCALMGRDEHLGVGPIVVLRHDERGTAAGA